MTAPNAKHTGRGVLCGTAILSIPSCGTLTVTDNPHRDKNLPVRAGIKSRQSFGLSRPEIASWARGIRRLMRAAERRRVA